MRNNFDKTLKLTIFTPSYNRAGFLPTLLDSIKQQLDDEASVEWLVIDDGSSDKTSAVLGNLASSHPELVRWVRVENGGKHRAINLAARLALGNWMMIVDSDDYLADGAISAVLKLINDHDKDLKIGLIRGLRLTPEHKKKNFFNIEKNPAKHSDWVNNQTSFDTAEIIRVSALKESPFPEYPGERFMAESWLWHALEDRYLTYYVNRELIICHYQINGLSANSDVIRSSAPISAMAVYEMTLKSPLSFKRKIRSASNWWRYRIHAACCKVAKVSHFKPAIIYSIPGVLLFVKDLIKIKIVNNSNKY